MTEQQAREIAEKAFGIATLPGEAAYVADATVLIMNHDGTYSVCDNGEEAIATTKDEAIRFIVDNLTA